MEPDACLQKVCKEVKSVTARTLELIEDMFDTMYDAYGVGLAAPQVGILKRIVVIDVMDDDPIVLINPVILETEGSQTGDEGCLSIPGKVATVTRPNYVKCEAYNEKMEKVIIEGEGMRARAICHEIDHLDGIMYRDIAEDELRDSVPVEVASEEQE